MPLNPKRMNWGGRAHVRRSLTLTAFIANRHKPELKIYRTRLEEKGKCAKAARNCQNAPRIARRMH